jgi:hypothetical protein
LIRFAVPAFLLSIAFASERLLDPFLLAWLQIKCVALDVLDDVFLQNLSNKALESALQTPFSPRRGA